MNQHRAGFTGYPFDRADHIRTDADALEALMNSMHARVLKMRGFEPELSPHGALDWNSLADVSADAELILLGLHEDKPHFAILPAEAEGGTLFRSPRLMAAFASFSANDLAVYGTARSLIDWHLRHGFCNKCGGATKLFRAGWGRKCAGCNTEHFPRVDPVVIMIAEFEGKALVGRNTSWPEGRYSALAGFLEPGETIEEAVARELFEEAGVVATHVRYVTSQPWPFPAQLMIACVAEVTSDVLTLAPAELSDALWLTPDEVRAALVEADGAKFLAPPPYAVAHSLLKHWAGG
jgi:NAD+ diphosphatase